jgi:hypothetical protein
LLVSCTPDAVGAVVDIFRRHGFDQVAEIGRVGQGAATDTGVYLNVV